MKYRLKHILEYGALRTVGGLVSIMPYRAALGVGWVAAAVAFHLVRWRRVEAERRIREVFGSRLSARQIRRVAWISLRNLAFNIVEMTMATRLNRAWLEAHAECQETAATLGGHVKDGDGAILAVIHMGNWDAAGIAMEQLGVPMLVIARSQKNPLFNAYIDRLRSLHESIVVDRDDRALMKKVLAWLKAGKVLAILIDLRAKQAASKFQFLGKEADLGRGIGVIARHSKSPIYPVTTIRRGWTKHAWILMDPIQADEALDPKSDSVRMTAASLKALEQVILDYPEQYFWYNKRWVLDRLK